MLVHQCHSSVISSDFRDYSWLRLGLGVGKWSRLKSCSRSTIYVDPGTHLTQQNQDLRCLSVIIEIKHLFDPLGLMEML